MKAIVIIDGSTKSAEILAKAKEQFEQVKTVTIEYGQPKEEIESAMRITTTAEVPQAIVDAKIAQQFMSHSGRIWGGKVVNDEIDREMPENFVTDNEALQIVIAHGYAVRENFDHVVCGFNAELCSAMEKALNVSVPTRKVTIC